MNNVPKVIMMTIASIWTSNTTIAGVNERTESKNNTDNLFLWYEVDDIRGNKSSFVPAEFILRVNKTTHVGKNNSSQYKI